MLIDGADMKVRRRWTGALTTMLVVAFVALGAVFLVFSSFGIHVGHFEPDPLVAALEKPNSADQLKASLLEANWKLQSSQVDETKKYYLLLAIVDVLRQHPEASKAWQIASFAITSRGRLVGTAPPDICGRDPKMWPDRKEPVFVDNGVLPKFTNCTIVLDDAAQIVRGSPLFNKTRLARYAHGARRPLLPLKNAHVIYRGGTLLPVDAIACEQCTFEFDVRIAPPERGRTLIRALLQDNDLSDVGVELSGSDEQDAQTPKHARLK